MFKAAKRKRIFVAFAIEDESQRNLLVGQAKNDAVPFDFVDMSVKEAYDEKWKTQCRTKIKGCDGMIALISKNTSGSTGEKWEIACAVQERVPVVGVHAYSNDTSPKPTELGSNGVISWTWAGIKKWIDGL